MKGVNTITASRDPGVDGRPGVGNNPNQFFGSDLTAFSLEYFNGDYAAINGTTPMASVNTSSNPASNSDELFNGNIRYMQTRLTNPTTLAAMPMLNAYKYDQLNRLKESRSYESGLSGSVWNPTTYGNSYYNAFSYDAMGNILTQVRHNRAGTKIEDMKYKYQYLDPTTKTKLQRNRLYHIYEPLSLSSLDATDIDNMGAYDSTAVNINVSNNYVYDEEGRLVKDKAEKISKIVWRVDGKVKEVQRLTGTTKWLKFDYDAMGHRIAKHVYNNTGTTLERSTYYILDAQGNQISTYDHEVVGGTAQFNLKERNIFGSSRIGSKQDSMNVLTATITQNYTQVLGNKYYEFSNHLGNVLTVYSDVKIALDGNSDGIVDGFRVPIRNTADYSPFGVQLDGRTIQGDFYRRGFNGMEKDDEVKGGGNSYDFGARMYDARVGRWWSVDPLCMRYPENSTYNFCSDNPIYFVDPDGKENIPALLWALNNMVNQGITSDYQNPWYGSTDGGWVYKPGIVPTRIVCYESCWISYMNGASATTLKTLKTGFSTTGLGFVGRSKESGGESWFKKGNTSNGRRFITDISKGELGDIIFMGESIGMEGHAVMLASEITKSTVEIDGVMTEQITFTALSTSSDSDPGSYGIKEFVFNKNSDGTYIQPAGNQYKFRGIGQMTNIISTIADKAKAKDLIQENGNVQKEGDGTGEGSGSNGSALEEDVD